MNHETATRVVGAVAAGSVVAAATQRAIGAPFALALLSTTGLVVSTTRAIGRRRRTASS